MVRIQNILCPVDFFRASENAAEYAIALAKKFGARVTLFHVVEPVARWAYELPFDTTELVKEITARSTEELKKLGKRAQAAKVPADTLVHRGEVDREIRFLIRKRNIDLVVMGTHGRRGLEKFFMGSTTERLLRKLNIPLLAVGNVQPKTLATGFPHILATTDFAEGTPDAIAYAFSLARAYRSKVTLLHVLNDVEADIGGRYREQLIRSIQRELENLLPDSARDTRDVAVRVETGLPIRRILRILSREKIDLIVMNIHGETLLDRLSRGSVAEKVVRFATIPVLVVPPGAGDKRKQKRSKKAA